MYSREIHGEVYTFGVSGKLIMNALVMYDRQTDSLWAQILGEAVRGELTGTELEFIPSVHTTWAEWKEMHPDTLALVKGYSGDLRSFGGYGGYFASEAAGVLGEFVEDDRLRVKEFVVGVEHGDQAVAYPYSVLNDEPVVNDRIGDTPVLVVFNPETGAGVAFSRQLEDGMALTFRAAGGDGLAVQDDETGTLWDGFSGLALEGPLAGTQLTPLKYTLSFWFGWKDWFPETGVYGVD